MYANYKGKVESAIYRKLSGAESEKCFEFFYAGYSVMYAIEYFIAPV